MSIQARAAADSASILARESVGITLTPPASLGGAAFTMLGHLTRSGVKFIEGIPVPQDTTVITLVLSAFLLASTVPTPKPDDLKANGWKISATDPLGDTISGEISMPLLDRSLDRATFNIKRTA